jgi:hypothetical protein
MTIDVLGLINKNSIQFFKKETLEPKPWNDRDFPIRNLKMLTK